MKKTYDYFEAIKQDTSNLTYNEGKTIETNKNICDNADNIDKNPEVIFKIREDIYKEIIKKLSEDLNYEEEVINKVLETLNIKNNPDITLMEEAVSSFKNSLFFLKEGEVVDKTKDTIGNIEEALEKEFKIFYDFIKRGDVNGFYDKLKKIGISIPMYLKEEITFAFKESHFLIAYDNQY